MASEKRQQLIDEANELGLEFAKNVTDKTLEKMIREEKGEPEPVDEEPVPSPAAKSKEQLEEEGLNEPEPETKEKATHKRPVNRRRQLVAEMKRKAMKTRVVTITNRDPRDNMHTTTAHLSVENQYFGVSKIVPLDVPVELEECLITSAETAMIPIHRDEIINGRRTGNKVTGRAKRYTVSYAKAD